MKKKTKKKQELVAGPHFFAISFLFAEKKG